MFLVILFGGLAFDQSHSAIAQISLKLSWSKDLVAKHSVASLAVMTSGPRPYRPLLKDQSTLA